MPNGGVSKSTFEKSDIGSKLDILYDQNQALIEAVKALQYKDSKINEHCREQWGTCDTRFKKLERHWYKVVGVLIFLAAVSPFVSTLIIKYWI